MYKEDFCFVIMPFKDELKIVYDEVIKRKVHELGLKCIRADEVDGSGNIVRTIVEHIYHAKLVIADLTGRSANVFYELGIAHSFGNNTIVIAQNVQEDVPFDVQNYKVIQYKDSILGGNQLAKELSQTISTFPEWSAARPSNPVQDFIPPEAKQRVSYSEFEELKKALDDTELRFNNAKKALSDLEKDKFELEKLRNQSKELETLRNLLQRLFQNVIPGSTDNPGFVEIVSRIIDEVDQQGEVSLDVSSQPGKPANKKSGKDSFQESQLIKIPI